MLKQNFVIELTEAQQNEISQVTNFSLKKLIVEFDRENKDFGFKGFVVERPSATDMDAYIEKKKLSQPAMVHEEDEE